MAKKSDGSVILDTRMNTDGFGKGVQSMKQKVGGLTSAVGKLGLAISAAFAVTKLIQFGKEAIDLGSDLQEVQNVVDVTFTTMNEAVNEFARNAAETAGLSETMAKKYVGTFGAMAKAFGFAEAESFDMATALTQLTGDVASFYNLTQDEAYTKLKSVFTGETESLKELGVVMTQNALDSFAMANGWGKTTAQMEEQEKVALRYAFVQKQLNAASRDFIRTQDSWANQTRILSLNFDSFKANIGQALINIFTPFLKVINQIVSKMAELSQHFVAFSEMLVGKQTSGGGGSPGETLADIESGYEDIADATDEATKAAKNYKNTTLGIDELSVKSSASTGGVIGGASFALSDLVGEDNKEKNEELEETVSIFETIKKRLEELRAQFPILDSIFSIIENKIRLIQSVAMDLYNLFTKPLMDNKDGFLLAAYNIASFVYDIFEKIVNAIEELTQKVRDVYDTKIHPVIEDITNDISELVGKFLDWFNSDMAPVLDRWGEKFSILMDEHISPFLNKFVEFFGMLAEEVGYFWNEHLQPLFDWFVTTALPYLTPAIEEIGNIFMETFGDIVDICGYLLDVLGGVIKYLIGTFTLDWEKSLEGLKEIFFGFINILIVAIEDFVNNRIIKVLNGMIDSANAIGNMVGVGDFISYTIPEFTLPKLATGAVIPPNAPFAAILGDQKHGTNLEAPADLIRQIVREEAGGSAEMMALLTEIARNTRETADKDLVIGDRQIAQANKRGVRSMGYSLVTEG